MMWGVRGLARCSVNIHLMLFPSLPDYSQADVKTLKGFFETVLTESYWDAHRDRIMKEAVTARPQYDRFGREL